MHIIILRFPIELACPPGHVHYKKSCYRINRQATISMMTVEERSVCTRGTEWSKHGHLVIINDWEENYLVKTLSQGWVDILTTKLLISDHIKKCLNMITYQ